MFHIGFRPMETILESTPSNPNSNPQSPIMATHNQQRDLERDQSLDALLKSLGRPTKDSDLFPFDLPLRSSSTSKMPTRNPSQRVRDWVKRSNTLRTAKVAEAVSPTTGRHRINIAHLGGGRVGTDEIQPAITVGLTPRLVRPQRSRAASDSAESRMTQWIDLYPEAFESFSPPLQAEHSRSQTEPPSIPQTSKPESSSNPHQHSQQRAKVPEPRADVAELEDPEQQGLRPAPLRTPTRNNTPEAEPSSSGPPASTPESRPSQDDNRGRSRSTSKKRVASPATLSENNIPTRNESNSKPNPAPGHARKNSKWKPLPQLPPQVPATEKPKTPAPSDISAISAPELVTPPLTPEPEPTPETTKSELVPMKMVAEEVVSPSEVSEVSVSRSGSASTSGSVTARYTREERIWLHSNYRGEAPFLQAWGLDIKKQDEREEGIRMVRELMAAEMGTTSSGHAASGSVTGGTRRDGSSAGPGGSSSAGGGADWSQGRYELS
ncbi:hypothetical protein B0T14DRAFT_310135 [Immersiella caudata]|uniref:Uncharacterized protein n=1 Tax=Immersiella caudata TaxID=314043 RepID=A0AA39WFQ5_9PEZI|nr:hypothetical protein B0T14DRAFT_310135 [Immersiella caudata]